MTLLAAARTCEHCGAKSARHDARFCSYCGAELPRREPPPAPSGALPGSPEALAARFRALARHEELERLMDRIPASYSLPRPGSPGVRVGVLAFVLGGTVALFAALLAPWRHAGMPLSLVLTSFAVLFFAFAWSRRRPRPTGPLVRRRAYVADKTTTPTSSSWGGGSTTVRTSILLEEEDGSRAEFHPTPPSVGARVVRGDMGVAYTQGRFLLDFAQVRV